MSIIKSHIPSTFFQTQDRYKFGSSDDRAKGSDKGVKRASLWERITFRSTKIIVGRDDAAQTIYVNTASLAKHIARKITGDEGICAKTQTAVKGFFQATKLANNFSTKISSAKDRETRRGDILEALGSGVKISETLGDINSAESWRLHLVKVVRDSSLKTAPWKDLFVAGKKTEDKGARKARPHSYHGQPLKGRVAVQTADGAISNRPANIFMEHKIVNGRPVFSGRRVADSPSNPVHSAPSEAK